MDDLIEDVTRLLFESSFMTLATADDDGVPWVSPVEFACDEDLRFYWFSPIDTRHSQNVRANPQAALSIYDCTYVPLEGHPTALYGEGPVEEFRQSELEAALPGLQRWISWRDAGRRTPRPRPRDRSGEGSPWRVYRLRPAHLFALHREDHPEHGALASWRVPVDLADSFARAYRSRLA
jgi:hypothetical protein